MKILKLLEGSRTGISITALSEKLHVKYETVKNAISFLARCGLLELSAEKHGGLVYEYVKFSDLGLKVAEVMKNDVLDR
jgi:predicted transcriptional regulator